MVLPDNRLRAFARLGDKLEIACRKAEQNVAAEAIENVLQQSQRENPWFTRANQLQALNAVRSWLKEDELRNWLGAYTIEEKEPATVAVIMAGNIPMVNFHDFLAVLITGNTFLGKLSSQDRHWMPFLAELLLEEEPGMRENIHFTEHLLKGFDKVIATGSTNSSRYFEYYFGKYPHIIRRNRNSLAVLSGSETGEELSLLGKDIFDYFGLGCRNVSKLLVPEGYDFSRFMEAIEPYAWVGDHHKYRNNYDYRKAIYLVNSDPFLDNNFLMLKPDASVASPVSVVHTGTYASESEAVQYIREQENNLQCVVGATLPGVKSISYGETQQPGLMDYPDNVDIIQFLLQPEANS